MFCVKAAADIDAFKVAKEIQGEKEKGQLRSRFSNLLFTPISPSLLVVVTHFTHPLLLFAFSDITDPKGQESMSGSPSGTFKEAAMPGACVFASANRY